MSRNSAGTYSLPSGNPVVSGTTVSTTWANNTLTDLATEVSNSLDRQGRGVMLAPLQATDGTASAPGITFGSETNSGLYRSASGDIAFVIAGVVVARWTAAKSVVSTLEAGTATVNGNITLAGSNPAATTAFQNVITKKSFSKAWANVFTGPALATNDALNVASVTLVGSGVSSYVRVTFAQPFANASYSATATAAGSFFATVGSIGGGAHKTTTYCDFEVFSVVAIAAGTNTSVDLTTNGIELNLSFLGQQ